MTTTFEDELDEAQGQVQQDLLAALDAATTRLRQGTELESAIMIREASEAIISVKNALEKFGR